VKLLDSQGGTVELLVNTIGAYDGVTAIATPAAGNYVISVEAAGPWAAEVTQPHIDSQSGVKSASGSGDSVIYVSLATGLNRLHLTNTGRSTFITYIYNDAGTRNLLVNQIGNYDGTVPQSSSTGGVFAIVVRSSGDWAIALQ
jgi:hypothetical protein